MAALARSDYGNHAHQGLSGRHSRIPGEAQARIPGPLLRQPALLVMISEQVRAWSAYATIPARVNLTREAVDRPLEAGRGDHVAFLGERGRLPYAELDAPVDGFAAGCRARGIGR